MESSGLTQPLLNFWYLIPVALLLIVLRSARFKGHLGEFTVNASARLPPDKNRFHLIKNVNLLTEVGTTQIDHIIVSPSGVFVVETKNRKAGFLAEPNSVSGLKIFPLIVNSDNNCSTLS